MTDFSNNISLAEKYLNRFAPKPTTHYINGAWVPADECQTFTNSTPIDNTSLGEVTSGSSHEVNSACAAAEAAFPEWRDMPGSERKKILNRFADILVERAEEIALVESSDCGQAIRYMKQAAMRGAANFRFLPTKHQNPGMARHFTRLIIPILPCAPLSGRWQ